VGVVTVQEFHAYNLEFILILPVLQVWLIQHW